MKKLTGNSDASPAALSDAGKKYFEAGMTEKAIQAFKMALKKKPDYYQCWFNLGLVYQKTSDFKRAVACYKNNIKYYAVNPLALENLALCYGLMGETDKALETVNILSRGGEEWRTYFNLGTTSQVAGRTKDAIEYFQKAIKLNPDFGLSYGQLYNLYVRICDWEKAERLIPIMDKFNNIAALTGGVPAEMPFGSVARVQDPRHNLLIAKLKSENIERKISDQKSLFYFGESQRYKTMKIRIGYLSADFHDHATVHLILGMFKAHDRSRFVVHAYSHGVFDESPYRKAVMGAVDVFKDISGLSDKEAAITIYRDNIDILIDLKAHTNGNRLEIMAFMPAPILVSWLGYPGTTGAYFIHYLIADKVVAPPNEAKYYTEKLVYLPDTYQVTDNRQKISGKNYKRTDFGLPEKGFVFSSFNQAFKITPDTFKSWMNILKRVPGSVLWLFEKLPLSTKNLRQEAKKAGVGPKRLIFAHNMPKSEHLKRLKLSDLALDTFTYNGHTTTSDCLWAGIPVITLQGSHFASRVSASLLSAIGLPELIAKSVKEYEDMAVGFAVNHGMLNKIKKKLDKNINTKPLFDTRKFTENIEKAYRRMYTNYLAGKKPAQMIVE